MSCIPGIHNHQRRGPNHRNGKRSGAKSEGETARGFLRLGEARFGLLYSFRPLDEARNIGAFVQ